MTAGVDAFESTTLFFMLVAWWTNPFDINGTSSQVMRKRYRTFVARTKVIPVQLFGPLWFLSYTAIAISMWLYLNYADTEKHEKHHMYYDAVLGLMIAHYVVNKLWVMLIFTMKAYWLAFLDTMLVFASALALEVLVWIHNNGTDRAKTRAAGGLLVPYVLWTAYIAVLSLEIAVNNSSLPLLERFKSAVVVHNSQSDIGRLQGARPSSASGKSPGRLNAFPRDRGVSRRPRASGYLDRKERGRNNTTESRVVDSWT